MTIEAQDSAIYVRCGYGDGDVIEIDRAPNDDMISITLWFDTTSPIGNFVDQRFGPDFDGLPFISLPRAEVLALGHMLIDLAQRQMAQPEPQIHPRELTGPH